MEKTLKRLAWLVSVTAFVGFGSVGTVNAIREHTAHEHAMHWTKVQRDDHDACLKDETQCRSSANEELLVESFSRVRNKAGGLAETFLVLTLTVPLTVWFLFFSFRWVLTGRKPWQRESLPPA